MRRRVRRLVRRVMGFLAGRSVRTALMAAAAVVGVGVVAWLWERGPNLAPDTPDGLSPAEQIQAVGQYRTTLLQATAAFGGVLALLYTARNYRLSRRGQITDRFTKALERLGSIDRYVRLGAVYALEQVVRDSPELQSNVVDVLVAFVRTHTRHTDPSRVHRNPTAHHGVHAVALSLLPDQLDHPRESYADIQTALIVLGRIPHPPTSHLDLSDLHLAGAWLDGANLAGVNLGRANLAGASLDGANLAGAGLGWANLAGAWLGNADLTGAHLGWANLAGAWLDGANLTGAWLDGANLAGAGFPAARMTAEQVNAALHADKAIILPAHLVWDPDLGRVREATAEEATTNQNRQAPMRNAMARPSGITPSRKSQGL